MIYNPDLMGVTPACQSLEQILLLISQSSSFLTAMSIGMSDSDITHFLLSLKKIRREFIISSIFPAK